MIQAVARQCGKDRLSSLKELHDAWMDEYRAMGWRYGRKRDPITKTHPDMVAFHLLRKKEREKDWVFFTLCEIARRMT